MYICTTSKSPLLSINNREVWAKTQEKKLQITVFVLIFFTYLPESQNRNIFTCLNPVYLSRALSKWVSVKTEMINCYKDPNANANG